MVHDGTFHKTNIRGLLGYIPQHFFEPLVHYQECRIIPVKVPGMSSMISPSDVGNWSRRFEVTMAFLVKGGVSISDTIQA